MQEQLVYSSPAHYSIPFKIALCFSFIIFAIIIPIALLVHNTSAQTIILCIFYLIILILLSIYFFFLYIPRRFDIFPSELVIFLGANYCVHIPLSSVTEIELLPRWKPEFTFKNFSTSWTQRVRILTHSCSIIISPMFAADFTRAFRAQLSGLNQPQSSTSTVPGTARVIPAVSGNDRRKDSISPESHNTKLMNTEVRDDMIEIQIAKNDKQTVP